MGKVIFGKPEVIRYCVVALLSGEHILLEDVPGVGKTLAGKAIAKSIAGEFARLQFTPDLLPSDITGSNVFNATDGNDTDASDRITWTGLNRPTSIAAYNSLHPEGNLYIDASGSNVV